MEKFFLAIYIIGIFVTWAIIAFNEGRNGENRMGPLEAAILATFWPAFIVSLPFIPILFVILWAYDRIERFGASQRR